MVFLELYQKTEFSFARARRFGHGGIYTRPSYGSAPREAQRNINLILNKMRKTLHQNQMEAESKMKRLKLSKNLLQKKKFQSKKAQKFNNLRNSCSNLTKGIQSFYSLRTSFVDLPKSQKNRVLLFDQNKTLPFFREAKRDVGKGSVRLGALKNI